MQIQAARNRGETAIEKRRRRDWRRVERGNEASKANAPAKESEQVLTARALNVPFLPARNRARSPSPCKEVAE